jgi:tetratricopeptide (TPR) repeat protein
LKYGHTISPEEWEAIENYLGGHITATEQADWEARMAADPILSEKLQEVKLMQTGIREAALQSRLNDFHAALIPANQGVNKLRRLWFTRIAAACVLFAVVTAVIYFLTNTNNKKQLFARYFEADPGLATAMSASEDYTFNRGMIDYRTGKYKEAVTGWRSLLASAPANDTLHYFTGVSFLALDQPDSAIHHFKLTLNNTQTPFRSDACWYLGLALVQQNKKEEALTWLQQTQHPKKDELLGQLK